MEQMMRKDTIRRHSTNTADIDRYRREALMLRAQARSEFFRSIGGARQLLGGVAILVGSVFALHLMFPMPAAAELPDKIAAHGDVLITTLHATGAQIYECKPDSTGKRIWQFREPIATLLVAGKTVGRHYAGPTWELADGSAVTGKVAGSSPGTTTDDIPLLKLAATSWRGKGQLSGATTIQRLGTKGGSLEGPCDSFGALRSVPYAADYVFYRKAGDSAPHQSN
jgi:uncharacterized protein DUF3455